MPTQSTLDGNDRDHDTTTFAQSMTHGDDDDDDDGELTTTTTMMVMMMMMLTLLLLLEEEDGVLDEMSSVSSIYKQN